MFGVRRALQAYSRALEKRPLTAKALTSGTLMALGDVFAQTLEMRSSTPDVEAEDASVQVECTGVAESASAVAVHLQTTYDWARTVRMGASGLLVVGPSLHVWYGALDKIVKIQGSAAKVALVKLGLDQALFAPAIIAAVYGTMGVMEGKDTEGIQESFRESYWTALKMNYVIWPLGNYFNFRYVPAEFRVLYAASVSFVWNAILSNVRNYQENASLHPAELEASAGGVIPAE